MPKKISVASGTTFKISVGSRAKGYATPDSDDDCILFVTSNKTTYLEYFTQWKKLQNHTRNKGAADEYTESDLLFGLRGVYQGTYPHLFMFGNTTNIPNEPLLEFIREIGNSRLKPYLVHLVNFDFNSKFKRIYVARPKHQLQKLFNLSYVDYCLQNNRCPPIDSNIALPALLPQELKPVYNALMLKRINQEEASNEEIELIVNYREKLNDKVLEMDDPEECPDLLDRIVHIFI